jgi:hypothetical protein
MVAARRDEVAAKPPASNGPSQAIIDPVMSIPRLD